MEYVVVLGASCAYVVAAWLWIDPWLRRLELRRTPADYGRVLLKAYAGLAVLVIILLLAACGTVR